MMYQFSLDAFYDELQKIAAYRTGGVRSRPKVETSEESLAGARADLETRKQMEEAHKAVGEASPTERRYYEKKRRHDQPHKFPTEVTVHSGKIDIDPRDPNAPRIGRAQILSKRPEPEGLIGHGRLVDIEKAEKEREKQKQIAIKKGRAERERRIKKEQQAAAPPTELQQKLKDYKPPEVKPKPEAKPSAPKTGPSKPPSTPAPAAAAPKPTTSSRPTPTVTSPKKGMSRNWKIGLGVGAGVGAAALGGYLLHQRRKFKRMEKDAEWEEWLQKLAAVSAEAEAAALKAAGGKARLLWRQARGAIHEKGLLGALGLKRGTPAVRGMGWQQGSDKLKMQTLNRAQQAGEASTMGAVRRVTEATPTTPRSELTYNLSDRVVSPRAQRQTFNQQLQEQGRVYSGGAGAEAQIGQIGGHAQTPTRTGAGVHQVPVPETAGAGTVVARRPVRPQPQLQLAGAPA